MVKSQTKVLLIQDFTLNGSVIKTGLYKKV